MPSHRSPRGKRRRQTRVVASRLFNFAFIALSTPPNEALAVTAGRTGDGERRCAVAVMALILLRRRAKTSAHDSSLGRALRLYVNCMSLSF